MTAFETFEHMYRDQLQNSNEFSISSKLAL